MVVTQYNRVCMGGEFASLFSFTPESRSVFPPVIFPTQLFIG